MKGTIVGSHTSEMEAHAASQLPPSSPRVGVGFRDMLGVGVGIGSRFMFRFGTEVGAGGGIGNA